MIMTEEEIKKEFKEASNKKNQLRILADQNVCSVREIKEILGIQKPKPNYNSPKPEIVKKVLCATLDSLEAKIKATETQIKELEEYKKTLEQDYRELAEFMKVRKDEC